MTATRADGSLIIDFPICGYYDKQRVIQYNPTDAANWVLIENPLAKKEVAMYPAMGRRRVISLKATQLVFPFEPRDVFRTVNYSYYIVQNQIWRVDQYFNKILITTNTVSLATNTGDVYADYLVAGSNTYVGFCDGQNLYIYQESQTPIGASFGIAGATDGIGPPPNPTYIAAFGNRFVVVGANTAVFNLTEVNLTASTYDINNIFSIAGSAVFGSEVGIIRQLGVFQNVLYMFTDFKTGLWSNRPSSLVSAGGTVTSFPFQRNTSIEFDRGIADGKTLDIAFDRMSWVAKSKKGLVETVCLMGSQPEKINTKAIDVLFQRNENIQENSSPFLTERLSGFHYEYENTIFYRLNAGNWQNNLSSGTENPLAASIEFNFDAKQWSRCIEKDGQRNRAQRMVHFSNRNLVTVQGERTVYEFTGEVYTNEISNPNQPDITAPDAYIIEPFVYDRTTPIITIKNINEIGYAEFETEYVEIDFAWGINTSRLLNAPYQNAKFIIDESSTDETPVYLTTEIDSNQLLITENSNLPILTDETYWNWYKPHIELYYSDDGGVSLQSADVQHFSDLGVYKWRMRWYNLQSSRNRSYRLYCVSASPLFVLGGCMKVKRISGGAD